ncbi:hypothetical protein AVDCRST_MAG92-3280 [uncultured Coleofasciculus sp.]|uniref:Uncharacterized protein n=1 Tax=uncultured Coleofasciculus sp. TaxID=1267456 RepID=A0A6J4JHM2_9CYAN|nr:hypothetical protein AVDCRST_MAG92-3280 [uncultured Coleofasciculus sp.]
MGLKNVPQVLSHCCAYLNGLMREIWMGLHETIVNVKYPRLFS